MMTTFESLDELLRNLPNSSDTHLTLDDIHTILANLPPSILTCYAPNLSYEALFQLLDSSNQVEIEKTCNILDKLLNSVDSSYLMSNFSSQVELGLHHHSPYVIYLCLEQLERVVKDGVEHLRDYDAVVGSVIKLLSSENLGIATKASNILAHFGTSAEGTRIVFSEQMQEHFKQVADESVVRRFRVYEAIVAIVAQQEQALNHYMQHANNNFLLQLLTDIFPENDNDILSQLNAIEIVTKLATCQHGYDWLESYEADVKLESLIVDSCKNPCSRLLLPGLVKLFGSICTHFPNLINSRYKKFVLLVLDDIITNNQAMLPVCMETLGVLAAKVPSKMALSKLGTAMLDCVAAVGELMLKPPTETKVVALQTIEHLLWLPVEEQTAEALRVVEKWFAVVFEKNSVSTLQSICMQPYMELKMSAFGALNAVAALKTGQKALRGCAGLQEYLLNRRTDLSNDGLHAKFKVICTLASSPYTEAVFGAAFKSKLLEYQQQGSLYVVSQSYAIAEEWQ